MSQEDTIILNLLFASGAAAGRSGRPPRAEDEHSYTGLMYGPGLARYVTKHQCHLYYVIPSIRNYT